MAETVLVQECYVVVVCPLPIQVVDRDQEDHMANMVLVQERHAMEEEDQEEDVAEAKMVVGWEGHVVVVCPLAILLGRFQFVSQGVT